MRIGKSIIYWLLLFVLPCQSGADTTYMDIAEMIANQGRNNVRFSEEMVAFYLEEPIKSKGKMIFEPPDTLIKIIEEPEYIKQVIRGNEVIVTGGDNEQKKLALSVHFGLEVMANTLRSLLSGEFEYLRDQYSIEFSERDGSWQMKLVPIEEKLEEILESVLVEGDAGHITRYKVIENNGDYTLTSLYDETH